MSDRSKEKDYELYKHIQKMRDGSIESFDFIYNETSSDVYRLISMIVHNHMDREDIMNEVYVQLWSSINKYNLDKSFRAWLHGITIHQISNFKRKNWRVFRIFKKQCSMLSKDDISYEPDIVHPELESETMELINSLSDKLKAVIVLRYYYDYSLQEIADILEVPLGTVKSRHHSALKQLKRRIDLIKKMDGGKEWILKGN
ncbi:RNA polymerase sigma-70 factor (ECF subfamily) [Oikeobacillus pervagus]|uniref:RNA polymerase sigma-70 factor (ECF subfamily) n=1 Tax=Oikeobacillus pervagus TaxID=1325931 RepID=A0AAJ1WID3_9BACI|nr:sigma-70 family RNA polymerase sigma factor [Oikeobacillus pervagus]MDQ0214515.1 RNA polymerase sigma-70 factor (ECF subfamily) [Oikeobacillus pervagus]